MGLMSGLNSEEPPVKYIVQALRIWKLGWFSPVEAKTVPGERILVTMMINNNNNNNNNNDDNNNIDTIYR